MHKFCLSLNFYRFLTTIELNNKHNDHTNVNHALKEEIGPSDSSNDYDCCSSLIIEQCQLLFNLFQYSTLQCKSLLSLKWYWLFPTSNNDHFCGITILYKICVILFRERFPSNIFWKVIR